MKCGVQDQGTLATAIVSMALALLLTAHWIVGSASSPTAISRGAPRTSASSIKSKAKKPAIDLIGPGLVLTDAYLQSRPYTGAERDLFSNGIPTIKTSRAPNSIREEKTPTRASPPSPPGIELRFFGFVTAATFPRKVFLVKGDDVFVASEGDVVDRRYKVTRINPDSVDLEDLLEDRERTLSLQAG